MKPEIDDVRPIEFMTTGEVTGEEVDRARQVVSRVLAKAHGPALHIRMTLSRLPDPAVPRPALFTVRLDLNGRPIVAHAAAPSMHEAISLTVDRLGIRLERASRDWEARRGRHTG